MRLLFGRFRWLDGGLGGEGGDGGGEAGGIRSDEVEDIALTHERRAGVEDFRFASSGHAEAKGKDFAAGLV